MKIKYKGRVYHLHWPERFDRIVLKVAEDYMRPNGTVRWKDAEADGALKGLPVYLTLRDISQRRSTLRSKSDPDWVERKKRVRDAYAKSHSKKYHSGSGIARKEALFAQFVPEDLKRKHGWVPRTIWTEGQKELLHELAEKYRKSKFTIDWITLSMDRQLKKLPTQDSTVLCKYYNSLKRKKRAGKKYLEKRRKDALEYKRDHYDTYLKNLEERRVRVKESVNEFLISKLELR